MIPLDKLTMPIFLTLIFPLYATLSFTTFIFNILCEICNVQGFTPKTQYYVMETIIKVIFLRLKITGE